MPCGPCTEQQVQGVCRKKDKLAAHVLALESEYTATVAEYTFRLKQIRENTNALMDSLETDSVTNIDSDSCSGSETGF
jgi:hypothetical protein